MFRFSSKYFVLALVVLVVELLIALRMDDDFVRPFVGDTLAVVLLYAAALSMLKLPRVATALSMFALGCGIELGQALDLVHHLGLEHVQLARVVIGTHYDARDFVAYAAALPLIALFESASRVLSAAFAASQSTAGRPDRT